MNLKKSIRWASLAIVAASCLAINSSTDAMGGCRRGWDVAERIAVVFINHCYHRAEQASSTYKWKLMHDLQRTEDPEAIEKLGEFYKDLTHTLIYAYGRKIVIKEYAAAILIGNCSILGFCCPGSGQRILNLGNARIGMMLQLEMDCCNAINQMVQDRLDELPSGD